MTSPWRSVLWTLMVVLLWTCTRAGPTKVEPLRGFTMRPYPIYDVWVREVQDCAARMRQAGDSTFVIERRIASAWDIVWVAVPTEAEDGRFGWMGRRFNGLSFYGDSIALSAQQLGSRRLVKHEVLHLVIGRLTRDTLTEVSEPHGTPWGVCEYR